MTDLNTNNRPVVGMGATYHVGSDSYACTVIEVSPSGHRIVLQHDRTVPTKRARAMGMTDEMRPFLYVRNPEGRTEVATRRKDGYRLKGWKRSGRVELGIRETYRDPSF